jgi:hypothetical protein
VGKLKARGVERLPIDPGSSSAVDGIPEDGVPDVAQVDADLVGPAGLQPALD